MPFYLGVGTGAADRLDLMDETSYLILPTGFRIDDDATSRDHQILTLPLHLRGTDHNSLLDARNAILAKLNQATLGGSAIQEWITLAAQLSGAATMVWWHVVSGAIPEPGVLRPYGNYIGLESEPLILSLRCRKGALGAPIVDDPIVVTGSDPTIYRAGVPGNMPALAEIVMTDQSTGGTILHGVSIGSRSMAEMLDADFEPFQVLTPIGAGTADTTDAADTIAPAYVTATAGRGWQDVAEVMPGEDLARGDFELLVRIRDETALMAQPKALEATGTSGPIPRQTDTALPEADGLSAIIFLDPATISGHTLVAKVHTKGTGNPTPTFPAGWVMAVESTGGGARTALWYYPNAPVHSGSITVTFSAAVTGAVVFEEWPGLTSAPLDVTASNSSSNTDAHSTGTTAITTQAAALAMTAHSTESTSSAASSDGYDFGWTQLYAKTATLKAYSRYKQLTATGTQEATLDSSGLASYGNLIAVFKATAAGALPNGSYQYRVAALDASGAVSLASIGTTITFTVATGNMTELEWQADDNPAIAGYRVYWKKDTNAWKYFDTGSTSPVYQHTTEASPTGTADPPDSALEGVQVRIGLALGSNGVVTNTTDPVNTQLGNGDWEWLRISAESLSPMAVPLVVSQPAYRLIVQMRHPTLGSDVAVDVVALAPADEAWFEADVRAEELDALREWVFGTNQGGHAYAFVRDPAVPADVSGAHASGQLMIGPGDAKLMVLFKGAQGASVVNGVSAAFQLTLYPGYLYLAGSR